MLEPSRHVPARGVAMCPMHDTSPGVPLVLSIEFYSVSFSKGHHPRSDVNIVRDEKRLACRQFDDEALLAIAVVVIRKDLCNDSFPLDLSPCRTRFDCFDK